MGFILKFLHTIIIILVILVFHLKITIASDWMGYETVGTFNVLNPMTMYDEVMVSGVLTLQGGGVNSLTEITAASNKRHFFVGVSEQLTAGYRLGGRADLGTGKGLGIF